MSRRNKYGVAPKPERIVDGILFASKAEAKRYRELELLERAGEITGLKLQPQFDLILPGGRPVLTATGKTMKYRADFRYSRPVQLSPRNVEMEDVVEEVKGLETREAFIRRAVAEAIYRIKIEVVR